MTHTTWYHPHKNSVRRLVAFYRRPNALRFNQALAGLFIFSVTLSHLILSFQAYAQNISSNQFTSNQLNSYPNSSLKINSKATNVSQTNLDQTNLAHKSINHSQKNYALGHRIDAEKIKTAIFLNPKTEKHANSRTAISPRKSADEPPPPQSPARTYPRAQFRQLDTDLSSPTPDKTNHGLMKTYGSKTSTGHQASFSNEAIWPKNRRLPHGQAEQNPYGLSPDDLQRSIEEGKKWFSLYPVENTPLLLPYDLVSDILDREARTRPFIHFFIKLTGFRPWDSKQDFYSWLGLTRDDHQDNSDTRDDIPVDEQFYGVSLHERSGTKAITFGCGSCHIGSMFGKKVIGLTVRFPRSNELFLLSGNFMAHVNVKFLAPLLSASAGETEVLIKDDLVSQHIGAKLPSSLGLDTSLAQVGLSLNKRKPDAWASFDDSRARRPPKHYLMDHRADSKPAVWWNVKYKTRWLSDGSLEGGNPVHTNFLWNEIGRGADLRQLEPWLRENHDLSRDMVNAILNTKPPRYVDFFGVDSIDVEKAKKGQMLFNQACAKCHGSYVKAWDQNVDPKISAHKAVNQPPQEIITFFRSEDVSIRQNQDAKVNQYGDPTATVSLRYHEQTPVFNVGTDPSRYLGMASFAESLNRLAISQYMATEVIPKKGYVAPPLDGIWARYPYFHNNAVPTLCEVLTAGKNRSKVYLAVSPEVRGRDFDEDCVGYPKNLTNHPDIKVRFDSETEGQNNLGHDEGIFLKSGNEIFNWDEKKAIIEFLKTL